MGRKDFNITYLLLKSTGYMWKKKPNEKSLSVKV